MKWLNMLAFLFTLMFMSSCTTVSAQPQSMGGKRPLPQSEFRSMVVGPAAPSPMFTLTPALASPTDSPKPTPSHRASSRVVTTGTYRRSITGEASWGYGFHGHVVTRYARGTVIRVCGRIGCTGKVLSWGYGPAKRTGRIADLDVRIFENVCGPRSMGVCTIKLEVYR